MDGLAVIGRAIWGDVRGAAYFGALFMMASGPFALLHLVGVTAFRWLGMRSVPWTFDLIWTAVVLLSPVPLVLCLLVLTWTINALSACRRLFSHARAAH